MVFHAPKIEIEIEIEITVSRGLLNVPTLKGFAQ